ncbi:MAG: helix-turn-helix domain-containing protein [Chloroflexota bacterium]|nr:helix-turn-helix domain-containing protein [Chloroflexota bacterium]
MATELARRLLDVFEHPETHSPDERQELRVLIEDRLDQPLTTDEAARVLGVSRPTVHQWLRARLLGEAEGSSRTKRLLDTASVYEARRLLSSRRLAGTPVEQVNQLHDLVEELYAATHPRDAAALEQALDAADHGDVEPVEDELIEAARLRRSGRRSRTVV